MRWFNGSLQPTDLITERFAETARFDKVTLHVNHDQRGPRRFETVRKGRASTWSMGIYRQWAAM